MQANLRINLEGTLGQEQVCKRPVHPFLFLAMKKVGRSSQENLSAMAYIFDHAANLQLYQPVSHWDSMCQFLSSDKFKMISTV